MYQHSITPISLPCALRIPEKGQIAHLNVHLESQLQIHSDSFVEAANVTDVSDLVGELQEMQNASNTSTVAELLKQGAGRTQNCFCSLCFPERNSHMRCAGLQFSLFPSRGCLSIIFFLSVRQRICVFVNPHLPISFIIKLATCYT